MNGLITEAPNMYQRKVFVSPTPHYYGEPNCMDYIKWGCPVCEKVGLNHQILKGVSNCPICNVNITWEGVK